MKIKLFILLLLITAVQINGEIRFVSKSGSSAAPYTSWQTAADRIQKAIDISGRGDTIYVGNGTYVDTVRMTPGIALIGSGMDSCIINSQPFSRPSDFYTVTANDSCILSGFHIIVSDNNQGIGIAFWRKGTSSIVEYNKITNAAYAIDIGETSPIIRHNVISIVQGTGIHLISSSYNFSPRIEKNIISVNNGYGISIAFGTMPKISNNTVFISGTVGCAFHSGGADSVFFLNNLIVCNSGSTAIENSSYNVFTLNNVIIGKLRYAGIDGYYTNVIENNCINLVSKYGLTVSGGVPLSQYNNVWGENKHYDDFIPDSTNLELNPMFANADSLDFHLQKYSPLIDSGDPKIKDVDGSRSDIGIFGGPLGQSYEYNDLAPRIPQDLNLSLIENMVLLKWDKNTENDFSYYNIYRDTIKNFTVNKSKLITKVKDTVYADKINPGASFFYKISAVDVQGNESGPGPEAGIITGVNNYSMIAPDYRLWQNYPNPFNPSTRISYYIKTTGYVKIYIYDLKGELIKTIENSMMEPGMHEAEFNTNGLNLASGIYFYKIDVKNEKNIPVFTEIKKMLFLK